VQTKSNLLKKFRIILCRTSHPGNIGSSARAIKTMGFSRLYLVKPNNFPSSEADALASGADDILKEAIIVESLEDALIGVNFTVGFTARKRELTQPHEDIRSTATNILPIAEKNEVALLFGNETNGLSNDEIKHCQKLSFIDANKSYSSLNLSQAVQIACHEIRMMTGLYLKNDIIKVTPTKYVSHVVLNGFFNHLESVLDQIGFLKKIQAERLMQRLRLMFNRSNLDKDEVNILRGILSEIQKKLK
jgi:tRNA/rRNA methyltransferase|tara:strand:- start:5 stop:745 length:741 start_codon:yes stop_codon:yes gene_type:complete